LIRIIFLTLVEVHAANSVTPTAFIPVLWAAILVLALLAEQSEKSKAAIVEAKR